MAGENYIIAVKKDVEELRQLEKDLDQQRKKELDAVKTANKIKIEEEKRVTSSLQSELKTRQSLLNASIKAEVQARKDASKQIQAQQKADSKFTGQSTTLGSLDAIKQQITYYGQLRNSVSANSTQFVQYTAKVNQLTQAKRELLMQTNMNIGSMLNFGKNIAAVGAGIVGLIALIVQAAKAAFDFAYSTTKAGAELEVLRNSMDSLTGSTEATADAIELLNKASSGNLNEKEVIEYYNAQTLLGFSLAETAQLLDIVERRTDFVGGSFEAANESLQRFIISGSEKGLLKLKLNIADVENATKKLHGKTLEEVKAMNDLEAQTIRTDVVIKTYGNSVGIITQKTQDNADKVASLTKSWDNFIGSLGSGALTEISQGLSDTGNNTETLNTKASKLGNTIGTVVGKLFDWGKSIGGLIENIIPQLVITKGLFGEIETALSTPVPTTFTDSINEGLISNINTADELRQKIIDIRNIQPMTPDMVDFLGGENIGRGGQVKGFQQFNLAGDATVTQKRTGSKGGTKKEVKEITTVLDNLKKELTDAKAQLTKLFSQGYEVNGVYQAFTESSKAIRNQREEIEKLESKIRGLFSAPFGTNKIELSRLVVTETGELIGRQFGRINVTPEKSFADFQSELDQKEFDELLPKAFSALEASIKDFANIMNISGDSFLGRVIQAGETFASIINLIFKVGETASMFSRLLGLLPFVGGLFGSSGAIGARAEGGSVSAGSTYLVGERGMELFTPNVSGYITNNQELARLVANGQNRGIGNMVNNVYLNASVNSELIVTKGTKQMNQSNRYKKVS